MLFHRNLEWILVSTRLVFCLLTLFYKVKAFIRAGHPVDFTFLVCNKFRPMSCRAGFDAPYIRPDGRVDLCPAWKDLPIRYSLGNVRKSPLSELWFNSPVAQEVREMLLHPESKIQGKCTQCLFFTECKGKCAAQRILAHGDMYMTPDPMCWRARGMPTP